MALFTTALVLSLVTSFAGSALSAFGRSKQGEAENEAAQYQAAVLRNNRIIAQRAAATKNLQTAIDVSRSAIGVKAAKGAQKVGFAGHGVSLDSESVRRTLEDTATFGRLNTLTVEDVCNRQAAALLQQGENFGFEANLLEVAGANAQRAGNIGAFSTILSGGGQVAQKWYEYKVIN